MNWAKLFLKQSKGHAVTHSKPRDLPSMTVKATLLGADDLVVLDNQEMHVRGVDHRGDSVDLSVRLEDNTVEIITVPCDQQVTVLQEIN